MYVCLAWCGMNSLEEWTQIPLSTNQTKFGFFLGYDKNLQELCDLADEILLKKVQIHKHHVLDKFEPDLKS